MIYLVPEELTTEFPTTHLLEKTTIKNREFTTEKTEDKLLTSDHYSTYEIKFDTLSLMTSQVDQNRDVSTGVIENIFTSYTFVNDLNKSINVEIINSSPTVNNNDEDYNKTTNSYQNKKYFSNLNLETINHILSSVNYDLSGCLINCSNHGQCKLTNQKYQCSCDKDFIGHSCKTCTKICQTRIKCLNGGTCLDLIEFNNQTNQIEYGFKCLCSSYYNGTNCENEIDLCENRNCSLNGNCKVNLNKTSYCDCFKFYNGTDCEFKSNELLKIEAVIKISSIIGIIILVGSYLLILANDLIDLTKKNKIKTKSRKNKKIIKF